MEAPLYILNPITNRLVRSSGRTGKFLQQQYGGRKYLPDMALVDKFNKLKTKQQTASYNGKEVTLYLPEITDSSNKKLQVYVKDPNSAKIIKVQFGHPDYEDYTIHHDQSRRQNYCARSAGIKCHETECGVTSPNYWSRMVLWNC